MSQSHSGFTKQMARNMFYGGTVFFALLFAAIVFDSERRIPDRSNAQAITPAVVAGKKIWETRNCIGCHTLNDPFHQSLQGPGIPGNVPIDQDFPGDPSQPYPLNQQDQLIKPQIPGDRNQAGTFLRRCTDCHGAVHGSYTDEHLRH